MTMLSGVHTIGFTRCITFHGRIYGNVNMDASYAVL
jgi:hypothetical protein